MQATLTAPLVNECLGVGVTSVARDSKAPELNPGQVHRRTNTNPEAQHTSQLPIHSPIKSIRNYLRLPHLELEEPYINFANNAVGQRVFRGWCDERSQGWRSAGAEPWTGSSTDKHQSRSTAYTVLAVRNKH